MTETKLEKERIRGFAGLIAGGLLPLNENKKFKEQFAKTDIKCYKCEFCCAYYYKEWSIKS